MDINLVKKYLPEYRSVFEQSSISKTKPIVFIKSIEIINTPAEFSPAVSDTAYVHSFDFEVASGILSEGFSYSQDSLPNMTNNPYARMIEVQPGHRIWIAKFDGSIGGYWVVTVYVPVEELPDIVPQKRWTPGRYSERGMAQAALEEAEKAKQLPVSMPMEDYDIWSPEHIKTMRDAGMPIDAEEEEDINKPVPAISGYPLPISIPISPTEWIPMPMSGVRIVKGTLAGRTGVIDHITNESYGTTYSVMIDELDELATVSREEIEKWGIDN